LQAVLDSYQGTILLVSHDRYLIDALATQIWEVDPDESKMIAFNGTYSQMKEERKKEEERLAAQQVPVEVDSRAKDEKRSRNASTKEERRKMAQLQELENTIAELEATLANLTSQLESPFVKPHEAAKLGTEYERVQKEMDEKLGEWEKMQAL
jgi:ATP-binding cassette, subfamily F, member 3